MSRLGWRAPPSHTPPAIGQHRGDSLADADHFHLCITIRCGAICSHHISPQPSPECARYRTVAEVYRKALGDRGPKSPRDERDRETKNLTAWCLRLFDGRFRGSLLAPAFVGQSVGLFFLGCVLCGLCHCGDATSAMMNEHNSGRGICFFFLSSRRRIRIVAESKKHRACVEGRHGDK